ncbi:DUF4435 domain-containing protein [Owenweeksia hongkongensis]|uniref:DUF4435 domain-containing protein n=1 Tax=Owenweeksia hongkongensis TaxID=253245 RepID=UPI003A93D521
MAFVRTTTGLNNQHLFHNVDYIVFVEGGESYTKTQIDQGQFNDESIDTLFWSKILSNYKTESKFKFKAVGSKTAVLQVAEDIVNNNLTTVYAAMDQEFDRVLGKAYKHNNILYTLGYSWENDVWNEKVIHKIVTSTTAKDLEVSEVIEPFSKFIKDMKFSVYADGYMFSKNSGFFPRPTNHLKVIDCTLTTPPFLKKAEIDNLFVATGIKKPNIYSFGSRKKICCKSYMYGHLLGDVCKLMVKHLLKIKQEVTGLGDEIIRRLAINHFLEFVPAEVDNHYQEIIK